MSSRTTPWTFAEFAGNLRQGIDGALGTPPARIGTPHAGHTDRMKESFLTNRRTLSTLTMAIVAMVMGWLLDLLLTWSRASWRWCKVVLHYLTHGS